MKTQGYNGTSVKDIVDAAAVPKGSFYNYFESKEVFAVEALEKVASESFEASRDMLNAHRDKPPMERLYRYFEENADFACGGNFKVGCFFGNMCQEMSDCNEAIRTKVRMILKRKTKVITEVLDEAKASGGIREDADTEVMAEFIFNAWEGALMRMKAARCREPLDAFLAMIPKMAK